MQRFEKRKKRRIAIQKGVLLHPTRRPIGTVFHSRRNNEHCCQSETGKHFGEGQKIFGEWKFYVRNIFINIYYRVCHGRPLINQGLIDKNVYGSCTKVYKRFIFRFLTFWKLSAYQCASQQDVSDFPVDKRRDCL